MVPYWGVLWPACSTRVCAALFFCTSISWVVYTCRLCTLALVGGGVGCWQPREGPAAVVLRLPPGHRAETQAPDGGGRRFHQGGREGGHPPRSSAWYTPGHPSSCAWRIPGHLVCSLTYLVYLSSYEASLYTALGKYQSSKTPGIKLYY